MLGEFVELETTRFGKINYGKNDIILMAKGLLGFEDFKRFILVSPHEQEPFRWLQSIDDASLAFLVIEPLVIKPDYKVEISAKDLTLLESKDEKNLDLYLLVSIPRGQVEALTANLQAPIIINKLRMCAAQLVISENNYVTRYPIFKALSEKISSSN